MPASTVASMVGGCSVPWAKPVLGHEYLGRQHRAGYPLGHWLRAELATQRNRMRMGSDLVVLEWHHQHGPTRDFTEVSRRGADHHAFDPALSVLADDDQIGVTLRGGPGDLLRRFALRQINSDFPPAAASSSAMLSRAARAITGQRG